MRNGLEEYLPLCAVYNMGNGFVAGYDIDNEPIEAELWFPDPRYRASRVLRESMMELPMGYELDRDVYGLTLTDYGSDIEDSLRLPFCTGGDLDPRRLLLAYSFGIFPWFDRSDVTPWWWAPLSRFVLYPDEVHISHSMRTLLNKQRYRVTVNEAFPDVIEACRTVDGRHEDSRGWLGADIVKAYTELWRQGYVKSIEVWDNETGKLAGGLYGVWINGCFMGESMFSYVPSGSKIALIGLCEWMRSVGGKVIDMQIETPHLKSMGGHHIPYMLFMRLLNPKAAFRKKDELLDISFRNGNPIP